MGPWDSLDAKAARIARPVEFEDVSMAVVTFASGALGSVVTSLLSPRELSRIRIDTTGGTLEVNHVYGYRDADWSWSPLPDAAAAADNGRDPGAGSQQRRRSDRPGRQRRRLDQRSAGADRAVQPRRPDQPAGRRPARRPAARTPRWPAPGRRWSSSRRCTPPPSRATPSAAAT